MAAHQWKLLTRVTHKNAYQSCLRRSFHRGYAKVERSYAHPRRPKNHVQSLRGHTSSMSSSRIQIPSGIKRKRPKWSNHITAIFWPLGKGFTFSGPVTNPFQTQCRDCQEMVSHTKSCLPAYLCRQSDQVPVLSTRSLPNSRPWAHKPLRHGLNDQDACKKKYCKPYPENLSSHFNRRLRCGTRTFPGDQNDFHCCILKALWRTRAVSHPARDFETALQRHYITNTRAKEYQDLNHREIPW